MNGCRQNESPNIVLSYQNPPTCLFRIVLGCFCCCYKWCLIFAYFSPDSDEKTFSLEEVILWITDSYLKLLYTDSYFKYIWINMDLFLTNTQRIHCWASDIMLHFSKSVLMNKKTNLHLGWPEGEDIFSKFSFWVNYSFKLNLRAPSNLAWVTYIWLQNIRTCLETNFTEGCTVIYTNKKLGKLLIDQL